MKKHIILKRCVIALAAFLIYVLAGVLFAYGRQPKVSEKTKQNTQIQDYYTDTSQVPERAFIMEQNGEALQQRIRLIENAKEEIVLSTFAFHADNSGKVMIGALKAAAERGVKVKILADGFESWVAMEGNPYFYALSSDENIEVKLYNRANPLKPWKIMGRLHDKYLIADGQTYILGGRNTYDFFLGEYPGHKNYDRDVFVYCEAPEENSSVSQLQRYFESVWEYEASQPFHNEKKLGKKTSVTEAAEDAADCYQKYVKEYSDIIYNADYKKDTLPTEKIALISNPIHTGAKEPVVWYQLGELMKGAKNRVKIHTPYIICNQMMYDTWSETAGAVPEFSVMTNSVANNGNPFGSADYLKNKEKILATGIRILEYEGGYSYHGKSLLIDDNISVIGSFNMDMRSTYLDTELMLVIRSQEVNEQLAAGMQEYEKDARLALADGTYENPYGVTPIPMTTKKKVTTFLVKNLLGWARFLL